MIGSVVAAPSALILASGAVNWQSQCAQFYKTGITAGNKAVKVQWAVGGPGAAYVSKRSLFVTVNIH